MGFLLCDLFFFYWYNFVVFLRNMNFKFVWKDFVVVCVVCCEDVDYFVIGVCDYLVCYKCCIWMCVLGKEIYCFVCCIDLVEVRWIKGEGFYLL